MRGDGKFAARVALFSALAYVLALASVYIPNVSLSFIAIFGAGALFGLKTGIAVGGIGMFLWTVFNPLGMAPAPIMIGQIGGMMLVGLLGGLINRAAMLRQVVARGFWLFGLLGLVAGLEYQIILTGIDTGLYGRSWSYFATGLGFSIATVLSNAIIFPACYPLIVKLAGKRQRYV